MLSIRRKDLFIPALATALHALSLALATPAYAAAAVVVAPTAMTKFLKKVILAGAAAVVFIPIFLYAVNMYMSYFKFCNLKFIF